MTNRVLLYLVPKPKAIALCLDPTCPFKASARDPERAWGKLQAHVATFHPEMRAGVPGGDSDQPRTASPDLPAA